MSTELPELFQKIRKRYPQVWKCYESLAESIRAVGSLDDRTQKFVKLGIAIGAGLEGAVHSHTRKCKNAGASDEEIYHAAVLAIPTIGWPSATRALSWIDDILKQLGRKSRRPARRQ